MLSQHVMWWLLAGVAVGIELMTGTFYLLMLAVGLAAGAIAALLGFGTPVQLLTAAVVGGGAVLGWHLLRGRRPPGLPASANPDVNLDIGETVMVEAWNADGTATVRYRGAAWSAAPARGTMASTGPHRVAQVVGSRLIVEKL